jgi:protein phosphatase-4 regulatory subunit 3
VNELAIMPYEASKNNDQTNIDSQSKRHQQVTGGGGLAISSNKKTKTARSSSSAATTSGSNKRIRKAGEESSSTNDSSLDVNQQQQQDLEGWRVKLYRLNADGTWDDCGTGRITCLYSDSSSSASASSRTAENNNNNNDTKSALPQQQQHPDQWLYAETGEATLCVTAESSTSSKFGASATASAATPKILLRTRILLRDAYQRQGDNIITWCEPCYSNTNTNANNTNETADDVEDEDDNNATVDLALSFQDNAGCLEIWRHITQVQSRAAALLRPVEDMAAQAAAQHHASLLQMQHRQESTSSSSSNSTSLVAEDMLAFENTRNSSAAGMNNNSSSNNNNNNSSSSSNSNHEEVAAAMLLEITEQMPAPPTLDTLDDIADIIATLQHVQQRDSLATFMIASDCLYLKQLLALFHTAEEQRDYEKLAALAACVKTILLLNDPSILELIITEPEIFEQVCSCLEYDPDLREKANHRWFLRERAKFRTVLPMEDPDLVTSIHRCFRVQYLRDTLLRPTMDESSLSTLSSLQTFIYGDVIKGVTYSSSPSMDLKDSYLVRVIRMLGIELHSLNNLDWSEMEASCSSSSLPIIDMTEITRTNTSMAASTDGENHADNPPLTEPRQSNSTSMNKPPIPIFQRPTISVDDLHPDPSTVLETAAGAMGGITSGTWKQYLAPQDGSVPARRLRRIGCLSFLRELFNMVRLSLQQNEKDNFFSILCTLEIDLKDDPELFPDNITQTSQQVEVGSVASTVRSD